MLRESIWIHPDSRSNGTFVIPSTLANMNGGVALLKAHEDWDVRWLNSADGHLQEPADLWTQRLPKRLREREPR